MDNFEFEEEIILQDEEEEKVDKPKMYKVLLHNDDYTTMEFVVMILEQVFHKSKIESIEIMLDVHTNGIGLAGIYTYEVATTNIHLVEKLAESFEYPFLATMEEV